MVNRPTFVPELDDMGWHLENTYATLPETLFVAATPTEVRAPRVALLNHRLAEELGLNLRRLSLEAAAAQFSGQTLPTGSFPIAQAYAGHQFGSFTMLGDGRAILLGEHRTPNGRLVDIQYKGTGRTQFSRRGDGLAALGPMLREYIISEAMAALGIPTTRSLAVVTTQEPVYRDSVRRGAILTRVAASHIRVGTFEYAARQDHVTLKALADYAINRHYPELIDDSKKYLEFFRAVADRQALLIAKWQHVGFIHGVMNTDNMAISGETIDYGPCAFMNSYYPNKVFSSIDLSGRYAYSNQPYIAHWNLARFGETLLPLLNPDKETAIAAVLEILDGFPSHFERYWLEGMRQKLGLCTDEIGDAELIHAFLSWLQDSHTDYTNAFRSLSEDGLLTDSHYQDPAFQVWYSRWQERLSRQGRPLKDAYVLMRSVNPSVIPRNHRVEEALSAAEEQDDLTVFHQLQAALASPYEANADLTQYRDAPADECGYRTFCGT